MGCVLMFWEWLVTILLVGVLLFVFWHLFSFLKKSLFLKQLGCSTVGILFLVVTEVASAASCNQVKVLGDAGGNRVYSPSVCYCSFDYEGKQYIQSIAPEGYGIPEPSATESFLGEIAGIFMDNDFASAALEYGSGVIRGKAAGGSVGNEQSANVRTCVDSTCSSYTTHSSYGSGNRYYFENTSAKGGKQVYSCEWYGNAYSGRYYFKNPRFDIPGVVDYMTPSIKALYYPKYGPDDINGVVVPNTVTAEDDVDPNPTITCSPSLDSKLSIGKHTITCTATDSSGNSNSLSFESEVKKLSQWISFWKPDDTVLGKTPAMSPSASSGLPITLSASGACSSDGSEVTVNNIGVCKVIASQAGNNNYDAAQSVTVEFMVRKPGITQVIIFENITEKTYGDADFNLHVTGGDSGNPVSVSSQSNHVCRVDSSNKVKIIGTGQCKIRASQAGNDDYEYATKVLSFPVKKADQVMAFETIITDKKYGDYSFYVWANSSVSSYYTEYSASGACSIEGRRVTIDGVGQCVVKAENTGNSNYHTASTSMTINVAKADQKLHFADLSQVNISNGQFTVSATGGKSGNPIVFSASGSCSIDGNTVSVTPGECSITASQAGNDNYHAAETVTHSLNYTKEDQVIDFKLINGNDIVDNQFVVSATGGESGNSVTFTVSGACSIEGTTVSVTPGKCIITASQAGNADYNAAREVSQSIIISETGNVVTDCADETATGVPKVECEALLALYNSTNGAQWSNNTNWNTNHPVNTWHGVSVSSGAVIRIDLRENNLAGFIPSELGNLTKLNWLSIFSNQLTGEIPQELGNCSNLSILWLASNFLTGEIPSTFGELTNLSSLDLRSNWLSGSIPAELGKLSNLNTLHLNNNKLSGQIPAELGKMSSLRLLYFYENSLSGEIPEEFSQLTNLEVFLTDYNKLSGVIPDFNPGMWAFNGGHNAFTGETNGLATKLNSGWQYSQTVAPGDLLAVAIDAKSVKLSWSVIPFSGSSGHYQVQYSDSVEGPYIDTPTTTVNKSTNTYIINHLEPGKTYYFRIKTQTQYAFSEKELFYDVVSLPSEVVSATTPKLNQTLTFPELNNIAPSDNIPVLNATVSSNLPISYAAVGACSVANKQISLNGEGICQITASQSGNDQYNAAPAVSRSFTISKLGQTIDFNALSNVVFGHTPPALDAKTASGLPISYSAEGVCSVTGDQMTITALGACTITASQAGNEQYSAATPISQSFNIIKLEQNITFAGLSNIAYGNPVPVLNVQSDSGLPLSFETAGVCSLHNGSLTVASVGVCTVTASQAGNDSYYPAASVSRSFDIIKRDLSLSFEPVNAKFYGDADFVISAARQGATADVLYGSRTLDVCTVSGNTVTIQRAGTCSLTADQAADDKFNAAPQATLDVIIKPVLLSIRVNDADVMEGNVMPAFSANYSGFVKDEDESVLSGMLNFTSEATDTYTTGSFKIQASGLSNPNYSINYVEGNLSISSIGLEVLESDLSTQLDESGKTDTVGVSLTGKPNGLVTVKLTPDAFIDLGAGIGQVVELSFDADNWNIVQNVTFTAVDNAIPDGTKWSHTIVELIADTSYSGITRTVVRAIIRDNDPGVILQPMFSNVELQEGGVAKPYYVRLSTVPSQPVTLSLTPDDHLQIDKPTVTFSADDSALSNQVVNVNARDDQIFKSSGLIKHAITTGDGQGYNNSLPVKSATLMIVDNDTDIPGVVIKPLNLVVSEEGSTATYTVSLHTVPSSPVTLTVVTDDQINVDKATIMFAADASALIPQVITVSAIDDGVYEDMSSSIITHSVSSADDAYNNLVLNPVTVNVFDSGDTIAPTVSSIIRQNPQRELTDADTLTWRVTFSEVVKNLDKTDFILSGSSATLAVSEVVSNVAAKTVYDVTVNDGDLTDLNGTVTLSFASNQDITDTASNMLSNTLPTGLNEHSFRISHKHSMVADGYGGVVIKFGEQEQFHDLRLHYDGTHLFLSDEMTGEVINQLVLGSNTSIVVEGSGQDDTLTYDETVSPLPSNMTISYDGKGQQTANPGDTLTIKTNQGHGVSVQHINSSDGQVSLVGGVTLNFKDLEPLNIIGGPLSSVNVDLPPTADNATLSTPEANTFKLAGSTFEDTTVVNPNSGNAVTFTLGHGDDTLNLENGSFNTNTTVNIDGGNGVDTVNWNAASLGVTPINLNVDVESFYFDQEAFNLGNSAEADVIFPVTLSATGNDKITFNRDTDLYLNNATLVVKFAAGYTPRNGAKFTILDHRSSASTYSSYFKNLSEGDKIVVNGIDLYVTYRGGAEGNDMILTARIVKYTNHEPSFINVDPLGSSSEATPYGVPEGSRVVAPVLAVDINRSTLSYAIFDEGDGALFEIDSSSGELRFITLPDFETPKDNNGDNVYVVTVSVNDGTHTVMRTFYIRVTDVTGMEDPVATIPNTETVADNFVSLAERECVPGQQVIASQYVAFFNRAPDAAGLHYWAEESGLTLEQVGASFFNQPETQMTYPPSTSTTQFLRQVYNNLFGRDPDPEGLIYWRDELDNGYVYREQAILAFINGAQGTDRRLLDNKTAVGCYFAAQGLDESLAQQTMQNVTAAEDSFENSKALMDVFR